MDDGVNLVGLEEFLHRPAVAEIHLEERDFAAGDLLGPIVAGLVTIGHIVRHNNIVAGLYEFNRHVAAYESGAS